MQVIILYTGIAGILGTTLGGLISILCKGKNILNIQVILGIASGFMLGITLFDLIPSALNQADWWVTLVGVIIGLASVGIVEILLTFRKRSRQSVSNSGHYAHMGAVLLIAIALHNFPEGMAIGGTALSGGALAMTILIMLHNIPEGMAIATPLLEGNVGKFKIFVLLVASGVPTVFGGLIGGLLGGIGSAISALTLSIAAGAMLYVVVFELNYEIYSSKGMLKGALGSIFGLLMALILIILL